MRSSYSLTKKIIYVAVIIFVINVRPAVALFYIDELGCQPYTSKNAENFFSERETYLTGYISKVGSYGLLSRKAPENISIKQTNISDGLFYQLYEIHPFKYVKTDGEAEKIKDISVLDITECTDCRLKAAYPGRAVFRPGSRALFKLISVGRINNFIKKLENISMSSDRVFKLYGSVISSLKNISIDYIMIDPCNMDSINEYNSSSVIYSYEHLR